MKAKLNYVQGVDDYIVGGLNGGISFTFHADTGQPPPRTHNSLWEGIKKRNAERTFVCGVIGRDLHTQEEFFTLHEGVTSKCSGDEAVEALIEIVDKDIEQYGVLNIISSYYFLTPKKGYEFTERAVYNWLRNTWERFITQGEDAINTRIEIRDNAMKTDYSKTQVGGTHYSVMKIQPIDIIHEFNLSWHVANAIKYLARHKRKDGHRDVCKAYDYLSRLLAMGYSEFRTPRRQAVATRDRYRLFASQFDALTAEAIIAVFEWYLTGYRSVDEAKRSKRWASGLENVLFTINTLSRRTYEAGAY